MKLNTQSTSIQTSTAVERLVQLMLNSKLVNLSGAWYWDFHSSSVFISDVMFSLPEHFVGTRGIIHPDDVERVKASLKELDNYQVAEFDFRIITTYGDLRQISGENIKAAAEELTREQTLEADIVENQQMQLLIKKRNKSNYQRLQSHDLSEQLTQTGSWYANSVTEEVYFSDNTYAIHGLPPQSLNTHFRTFDTFIHEEDRQIVSDTVTKSYSEYIPVHLQYRIVRADKSIRFVQLTTRWLHNEDGQNVLYGVFQDLTDLFALQDDSQVSKMHLAFQMQLQHVQEQHTESGYWSVNLLTKKTLFSDNLFKILGLKPRVVSPDLNIFLKYVHPDDHTKLVEANKVFRSEHKPPNLDFRIVRADGKIRHLRQSTKIETNAFSEPVMIGFIKDVTSHLSAEARLKNLQDNMLIQTFALQRVEASGSHASWHINLETRKVSWSDMLFPLLGYRPSNMQPSLEAFSKVVHPADISHFEIQLQTALKREQVEPFYFRMLRKGELIHIKATIELIDVDGTAYLVGTFKDISEQRELENQLVEKAQLLDFLNDSISDRLIITDSDNRISYWNRAFESAYVRSEEEIRGNNFFEVYPEFKREEIFNSLSQVLSGKTVRLNEVDYFGRGDYNVIMLPLRNGEDEIVGVLQNIRDVTELVAQKNMLKDRLLFIEGVLDSLHNVVVAFDKNMNYLYWNRKAEEFFGISRALVIGQNVLEFYPGLLKDPLYGEFRRALKGEIIHVASSTGGEDRRELGSQLIPIKNNEGAVTAIIWIINESVNELYHGVTL